MWFGCAQRADGVTQTGKDYADMEGLCYKMAFNYEMAKHPDPFTEAKGYNGPVLLLRADDDRAPAAVTHRCTPHPMWTPLQAAATTLPR